MDIHLLTKATSYIRSTLKRALHFDTTDDQIQGEGVTPLSYKIFIDELESFYFLLERHPLVRNFLQFDVCYLLADNYLIAMAITYLKRAQIDMCAENVHYFFSALYLAHEMEEDSESLRTGIIPWYPEGEFMLKSNAMHYFKNKIWIRLKFECYVSKESCDKLMKQTTHWSVWGRKREEVHAGALRMSNYRNTSCKRCFLNQYAYTYDSFRMNFDSVNKYYLQDIFNDEDELTTSDWEIDPNTPISTSEKLNISTNSF